MTRIVRARSSETMQPRPTNHPRPRQLSLIGLRGGAAAAMWIFRGEVADAASTRPVFDFPHGSGRQASLRRRSNTSRIFSCCGVFQERHDGRKQRGARGVRRLQLSRGPTSGEEQRSPPREPSRRIRACARRRPGRSEGPPEAPPRDRRPRGQTRAPSSVVGAPSALLVP